MGFFRIQIITINQGRNTLPEYNLTRRRAYMYRGGKYD
jgi:hypothetical protein